MYLHTLLTLFGCVFITLAYKPCPLLSPVFEPPTNLSDASIFQNTLIKLKATLDNATKTGMTAYGLWPANNNSFSVGVFDISSPSIFSYQYSSPVLQESKQGVQHVTEESIYRVGSVSKLITIYLFLIEVGPTYWNHPVTDFVPELEAAARKCSALANPIDCVDWADVTLGALASQMAGIARDCEFPLALDILESCTDL